MEQFSEEYIKNVRDIIKNNDKEKAKELLKGLHPADIAELYQALDLDEAEFIYMLLDSEKAADVLIELDEDDRKKLLKHLILSWVSTIKGDVATLIVHSLRPVLLSKHKNTTRFFGK